MIVFAIVKSRMKRKVQRDIDRLGRWARKWGMKFQPVKCSMVQLTNKRSSKIQANYTLEGTVLENVEGIKYLGVTIINESGSQRDGMLISSRLLSLPQIYILPQVSYFGFDHRAGPFVFLGHRGLCFIHCA